MTVPTRFRHVIVALDVATHDAARLDQAVALAAMLRAELTGVFVEDLGLLRTAALPFARRINLATGVDEEFGVEQVERELRSMAFAMRSTLELAATRARLIWSFRSVRGSLRDELLSAGDDVESLVLSAHARAPAIHVLESHFSGPLLVRRADGVAFERIATLFRGTPDCESALRLALTLSRALAEPVRVLVVAANRVAAARLSARIGEIADSVDGSLFAVSPVVVGEESIAVHRAATSDTLLVLGAGERGLADRIGRSFVQVCTVPRPEATRSLGARGG